LRLCASRRSSGFRTIMLEIFRSSRKFFSVY
jgi:hypothetical protein